MNVSEGLGKGSLSVIKWIQDLKEPYRSTTELVYGTIANDFTYYLTKSEQIPSAIAVGEYLEKDGKISHAGGILIQAMPDATENEIGFIETTINLRPAISEMLIEGFNYKEIFDKVLGVLGFKQLASNIPVFRCTCSYKNAEKAVISLGVDEIKDIIENEGNTKVVCDYCGENFDFSRDTLEKMVSKMTINKNVPE